MYKPKEAKLFGAALKRLLHEKGLSDRQFAKQADLEHSYVSKLLNPKPGKEIAEPRKKTRQKLAKGLGITEQELLEQIARCSDSEAEKTISAPLGLAETEEVIAKPHQESGEAVDASVRELNAKRGVDYERLRNLLAIGKWREADEETRSLILCLVRREIEGSLWARDINKLPCQDLHTIDKLWVEYSNRHFGFSVQKRIWKDVVKSRSNPNYRTLCRFGECVGWHMNGSWLSCPDLSFTGNSAPVGHLPATFFIIYGTLLLKPSAYLEGRFETQAEHGSRLSASCFFSRIETCKL